MYVPRDVLRVMQMKFLPSVRAEYGTVADVEVGTEGKGLCGGIFLRWTPLGLGSTTGRFTGGRGAGAGAASVGSTLGIIFIRFPG